MAEIKTPLELYKLLKKTNCGQCRVPSCMAFAVAVIQGQKQLHDCPELDSQVLAQFGSDHGPRTSRSDVQPEVISELRRQVAAIDFSAAAARIGAGLTHGRLAIPCLGKDFLVQPDSTMVSECHANNWVLVPLLHYIIHCQGSDCRDEWVPFGELRGTADWRRFFAHRCEDDLRQLVDAHSDLVFELLTIFGAQPVQGFPSADHALVISPLPKVPLLLCYWQPEEGFDSKLQILFDRSAESNVTPEALYLLSRGIVEMFRQLIIRHSKDGKLF